jgi:hypothetical protein
MIEDLSDNAPLQHVWGVLDTMYSDPTKNWLAGASIQLALNGTHLPWTSEGWSFLPVDLSDVSGPKVVYQNESGAAALTHPTNVSIVRQSRKLAVYLRGLPIT